MIKRDIWAVCIIASLVMASFGFNDATRAQQSNQLFTESRDETIEGTLEILFEHDEDGRSREVYYLNNGTERLELRLASRGPELRAGSRIRVRGKKQSDVLSAETVSLLQTAAVSNNALGEQRRLVMLFNFQDQPTNKPWTADYIRNLIFNDINQYYQQLSYGSTWVTGDLVGWYTVPVNSTDCSTNLGLAAENGARALGYDPDSYAHKIYIYPSGGCRSRGGTTMASTSSTGTYKTWVYMCGIATFYAVAHEFGHSLGFKHSNALACGGVSFGSNCTNVSYGDNYDLMGYYNNGVVNSYHRDLAGWLGPRIQTVTTDGIYTLTPTGGADVGLKGLRIPQSYDPATGSTTYYYIEYRQPTGYDSFLSQYPGVTGGVLFHLGTISNDLSRMMLGSQLLDMTPATTGRDEALAVGRSYTDSALPMTVTVLSAGSSGATVSVQFSAQSCVRANPTLTLTPASGQSGAPGSSVSYTVTVVNNDSSVCSPSSFNLQAAAPQGWSASYTSPTLTVNPGSTASTTLQVSIPASATAGTYSIGLSATNSSTGYTGSATATCTVATSLGVAVATDRTSYTRKQPVNMTATVTAGGVPVAGASVSFVLIKSNGASMTKTAMTGASGVASVQFKLNKTDPVGTYQGRGTASFSSMSANATTNFTVR